MKCPFFSLRQFNKNCSGNCDLYQKCLEESQQKDKNNVLRELNKIARHNKEGEKI